MARFLKKRGKYLIYRATSFWLLLFAIALMSFILSLVRPPLWITLLICVSFVACAKFSYKKVNNFLDGDDGEYDVEKVLKNLPDEFQVIPDVKKTRGDNIDFVVVGPTGVFAIEVKHFRHYLRVWKRDPIKQVRGNAAYLGDLLNVWVNSVLVFNKYQYLKHPPEVKIVLTNKLVSFLQKEGSKWYQPEKVEEMAQKILASCI